MKVTLANIKHFMTLGGVLQTIDVTKAVTCVRTFWKLLFRDLSENEEPHVDEMRLRHLTGGLLFYYELRKSSPYPYPKVYVPVRHLCQSDAQIVMAVDSLYRAIGDPDAAIKYCAIVRESL